MGPRRRVCGATGTAVLMLAMMVMPAGAQTIGVTTGAVNGRVTDGSDGTLPGVVVSISGTAQMGVRTAVTGGDGVYRFPGLAPGDYRLTYELGGFATAVRDNVSVPVGVTATLDVTRGVATLEQPIVVTGAWWTWAARRPAASRSLSPSCTSTIWPMPTGGFPDLGFRRQLPAADECGAAAHRPLRSDL